MVRMPCAASSLIRATMGVACLLAAVLACAQQSSGTLKPTTVKDLYYGDVLFYYFQDDYFGALTRLRAAQEKDRVSHHAEEAELLLGGLYLSYGQHLEAGRIFERLLASNVAGAVRDRAWFYLGKIWYQRGYWQEAERALREVGRADPTARVQRVLSPALRAELHNLLAQVLINQGRYDEAITLLKDPAAPPDWQAYAQFNLGVALVRAGRLPEAAQILDAVGQLNTSDEELLALKDKANVALGYAYLQAGQPAQAKPILQRVRLEGSQSNKALLAFGWAESAQERYTEALVPWMELRGRNLLDAAVQESYLAIPFAFAKLKADAQAVEYYTAAARSYEQESARIDESIATIRSGGLLDTIAAVDRPQAGRSRQDKTQQQGWFWQLQKLPDAPESRYLYQLLAGHEFQEGLKNYRDLQFMQRNLSEWAQSVDAFGDMLDTRRLAYEQRLPKIEQALAGDDPDRLTQQRVELESRLNTVEKSGDFVALGTAHEQEMWAKVASLEDSVDEDTDEQTRAKLKLVKGVLYWQLNESFKARLWTTRRSIKELDAALREMQQRWLRVQQARVSSPQTNAAFAKRVQALKPRIDALGQKLEAARAAQRDYLSAIAIQELQSQKERLINYQMQARYALATIYDRATASESKP